MNQTKPTVSFIDLIRNSIISRIFMMASIFTGLYGFLYVILRLEDYSLLMGSVGLFGILAAVMLITRKIDWYPTVPGPECSARD